MISFIKVMITATCIFTSSMCYKIKTFYSSEERQYTIIGDENNKYYGLTAPFPLDPNILKVNYVNSIRDILIKHIDEAKLSEIDKGAHIFVKLYFSPNLKVKEVYFGFSKVAPMKIMSAGQLEEINDEIKEKVVGEKNLKRMDQKEIDDLLSKVSFVEGHGIGFYLQQLMKYKHGQIAEDKLLLL